MAEECKRHVYLYLNHARERYQAYCGGISKGFSMSRCTRKLKIVNDCFSVQASSAKRSREGKPGLFLLLDFPESVWLFAEGWEERKENPAARISLPLGLGFNAL